MSAETLRRAATLMRERAEAASPGPWSCDGKSGIDDLHFGHVGLPVLRGPHGPNSYGPSLADTQHMAGMNPLVALAVADLLDAAASDWTYDFESYQDRHLTYWRASNSGAAMPAEVETHIRTIAAEYADGRLRPALAVARAYLEEVSQ